MYLWANPNAIALISLSGRPTSKQKEDAIKPVNFQYYFKL